MRSFAVTLILVFIPSAVQAQAVWSGPSGGGMFSVQEAAVLAPGHFSLGFTGDNYDRDPLGLDIWDLRIQWRVAIMRSLEFYGRYDIGRAVSIPAQPAIPPQPTDVIVLPSASWDTHQSPFALRSVYWPMPHLDEHPSRIRDLVPGEYTLGIKGLAHRGHHWTPSLSVSIQGIIPGDRAARALRQGSGTGRGHLGIHAAGTITPGIFSLAANLGYTIPLGAPSNLSDRIFHFTPSSSEPTQVALPHTPPALLAMGCGARYRLHRNLHLIAEISGWRPVGGRPPTLDGSGTSDILAGAQVILGAFSLNAGIRQHLSPQQNDLELSTGDLAGALDFSNVSDHERRAYLARIGVDPSYHRPDTALIIVGAPREDIPQNARLIPKTRSTSTTGNTGIIVTMSISF